MPRQPRTGPEQESAFAARTVLYPRLFQLAQLARQYDIGLNIDAEEADRLDGHRCSGVRRGRVLRGEV